MKYLIVAAIALSVIVMASIFWRAFGLNDEELPPAPPPKPPAIQPIVPPSSSTTTTTAAPTTTTTARARTAPTVAAATASRPLVVAPVGELQDMIRQGFAQFGPEVAEEAVRVAGCESTGDPSGQHLDPNAVGDEGEIGLFQIHPKYHTARAAKFGWSMNDLFDPAKNIVVAVDILAEKRGRWSPTWSCGYAA